MTLQVEILKIRGMNETMNLRANQVTRLLKRVTRDFYLNLASVTGPQLHLTRNKQTNKKNSSTVEECRVHGAV